MSFKQIIFLTIAALVVLAQAAYCESFRYNPHGKRDPFISLIVTNKPAIPRLSDVISIDDIRLQGIATGARGERSVVINGELMRKNQKIGEVLVKEITSKNVTITVGADTFCLSLPEEGGGKR
jgi:hypothetical protein